ncbi:MAG: hypothetical protein Q7J23_09910 [Nitrosomonas sp.]|uniref:hypothetical protein n=1 Tax=Nitrosomonas sp. TaxID=42353 RepID=UPI0027201342|nr:hypothetical protein [Nitrosomonas sp.]MDO9471014.1 hypothetical protein [Nitrosomonas sp.]MDP1787371.1 hypothetical protein [Nitrosomonas sp.]
MIASIRNGLDYVLANAHQLPKANRWSALARYIINRILRTDRKIHSFPARFHLALPLE